MVFQQSTEKYLQCGLELDLVAEEDEDVRMARLLNVQAKTDADERRQEDR